METNIKIVVFEDVDVPGRDKVLAKDVVNELESIQHSDVARQMVDSGVFVPDLKQPKYGDLYFPSFLNGDKTINLERLELSLILSVRLMDKLVQENSEKLTVFLSGFNKYFDDRGIRNDSDRRREELTFAQSFAKAVVENESIEMGEEAGYKDLESKYEIIVLTSP